MLRSKKQVFVKELEAVYNQSSSIIVTHYHNLTVAEITILRRTLRANGAGFKVVKNTLSKIAAGSAGVMQISGLLSGPTALAYSKDPVVAAKYVVEFAKTNDKLKILGGIVNDQVLSKEQVYDLATLPSLDELKSKLIGILQAPAAGLARVLQAPAAGLARVFQAYSDKN